VAERGPLEYAAPMSTVAIVSGYGPSLVRFRGPLIARIVARGHRVVALAPDPTPPTGFAELGADYVPLPLERAGTDPVRDLAVLAELRRAFRRIRPDVLLAYNVKPMVYGLLAGLAAGVPRRYALVTGLGYLFLPDGTRRQRLVSWVARPMYRAALQAATAVFVQNPDDQRDLRRAHLLPRRTPVVRVAGSGIDLTRFPRVPPPDGPPTVLFIGRLLKDKGIHELVAAARIVRAKHPEVRFELVGGLDPNPSGVTAAVVERWKAEGVVDPVGEKSDVRPHLAACAILALPSYREGTPRSVLEAMATGRPVVTTDAPGCRETVVDGENGLLVPVKDADALAAAILRLVEDRALRERMGGAGRARAEAVFDVDRVVDAMIATMEL
jgi:glycosyltransferase involved in cell wall biosynthesis